MNKQIYLSGRPLQNRKGFTLIELLAVIVILAIIAIIATPIVLNIISDSKENTIKINLNNLKHSMELYYMDNQLKTDIDFPKRFNFPNNELNIKGTQPDSGFGVIYENGEILLSVKYSDKEFVILPGEETYEEGNYIGLEEDWLTDGNGTLHMYKKYNEMDHAKFINNFSAIQACLEDSETSTNEKKICVNSIDVDISTIPYAPKNELIKYRNLVFEMLDTGVEPEIDVEKEFPILIKLMDKGELDDSFDATLKIPNYVLHSDNTLEPIITIGPYEGIDEEGNESAYLFLGEYPSEVIYVLNNLIFPSKIEEIKLLSFGFMGINNIDFSKAKDLKIIGNNAFYGSNFSSKIIIPKNVEVIGGSAFYGNYEGFKTLIFEGAEDGTSKLKEIGSWAFSKMNGHCGTVGQSVTHCTSQGYLEGTLYIPATVEKIGDAAFTGMDKLEVKFVGAEDGTSKLKEIGPWAFYDIGNKEEIVLPGTITKIDMYAFHGTKTKYSKMIIKKENSTGITFGNSWTKVTPTYEP